MPQNFFADQITTGFTCGCSYYVQVDAELYQSVKLNTYIANESGSEAVPAVHIIMMTH